MKAFILAAGFGTRLRPYTNHTPKPLFPIGDRPLLDIMINRLIRAGCDRILINTHHLHQRVEDFLASRSYPIPVKICYEPEILETGGAIRNMADGMDTEPLIVINGDILCDIDLTVVSAFHEQHPHPVTLVLHDCPAFNHVRVDPKGYIRDFGDKEESGKNREGQRLAFTGIHIISPEVTAWIPPDISISIIDIYRHMLTAGLVIKAFIAEKHEWHDIGTPVAYHRAACMTMTSVAFQKAFPCSKAPKKTTRLKGDGSDRCWYRITDGSHKLIMVDHGIRETLQTVEAEAFIHIGHHLKQHHLPVPEIYESDPFSGLVFMEDLGDTHLQDLVTKNTSETDIPEIYRRVIDLLIRFSQTGIQGFQSSWTWQTVAYDRELILEKECRYFVDAFLAGYLKMNVSFDELQDEFEWIADNALQSGIAGLMHRDFQSRNIMFRQDTFYIIDFQGARPGPIQYDLASLLIDPYVALPHRIQTALANYAANALCSYRPINPEAFHRGYTFCRMTRNFQILGAYGYLSRVKGKTGFEQYIPQALNTLQITLDSMEGNPCPGLKSVVKEASSNQKNRVQYTLYES
jgi:aminoglycoside/choline kinase family phosphotransferase/choline kinase